MSELTYESAFPGRFLKAALFEGKHVTLTIERAFMETLEGDKGKENKLILAFEGKSMQLVCNKTNAFCLKEMFTNKIAQWVGKRVTFHPTQVNFGPKKVDAIRVFGSPDLQADVEVQARIGRKNFTATLRKVAPKNGQAVVKVEAGAPVDPRVSTAFGILGYTAEEQGDFLANHQGKPLSDILAILNVEIEKRDAVEA